MKPVYKRLATTSALAIGAAVLAAPAALATADPLAGDAVTALAVAHCQADPDNPLGAEELAPVVLGESDVEVVPGEITAHLVRLEIAGTAECTVGVLHRDAQLAQVAYEGTATVAGTETEIELGNLGKSAPVDPTTEVELPGSLVPIEEVADDPAYDISLVRTSRQTVQIAVSRGDRDAAAKQAKREAKAAADLLRKQQRAAAHGKHADKALAAAQRQYDRRMAAAQKAYEKATAPRTVTRPVEVDYAVSGTVARADSQG